MTAPSLIDHRSRHPRRRAGVRRPAPPPPQGTDRAQVQHRRRRRRADRRSRLDRPPGGARHFDDGWTLEVNRSCVADGYPNAGWRVIAERSGRAADEWDKYRPERPRLLRGVERTQRTLWEASA